MNNEKKRLLKLLIFVNAFTVITLLIFGPYEIYISNRNDFEFVFKDFYWIPLLVGLGYFIIVTMLGLILPVKVSKILLNLEFALTLCCYIQAMFLNGKMEALLGQKVSWDLITISFNLCIWFAIIVAVFIVSRKLREKADVGFQFIRQYVMTSTL